MPKRVLPLTDLQVKNARARDKPFKMHDGGGLFLLVMPVGSKLWRLKYFFEGKEKQISLGAYPVVTLSRAREKRMLALRLLDQGLNPSRAAADEVELTAGAKGPSFEKVAREWHHTMRSGWTAETAETILRRLEADIFPSLGRLPVSAIRPSDIVPVVRAIEERGAGEVARRSASNIARVFMYAYHAGLTETNPAMGLSRVLRPRRKGHYAAIDSSELPQFLRALGRNEACMGPVVRAAMRLMLLLFVRTSELLETPWTEIDLDQGKWIIPWQRMKMGRKQLEPVEVDHDTCPSRQALQVLRDLHDITGGGRMLFPNERDPDRPMSSNALLKALERMGYKGLMTGHGFRALAMSTLKEVLGYRHEVVDRQLAHIPKDKLAAAYDRAHYLQERKQMMQDWADYLDRLEAEAMSRR